MSARNYSAVHSSFPCMFVCQVPEMLEVLHIRLQVISEEQVKVAVAQSILILATQHLQTVINTLLSYPLPFDRYGIFSLFSHYGVCNLFLQGKHVLRLNVKCMCVVPQLDQ